MVFNVDSAKIQFMSDKALLQTDVLFFNFILEKTYSTSLPLAWSLEHTNLQHSELKLRSFLCSGT